MLFTWLSFEKFCLKKDAPVTHKFWWLAVKEPNIKEGVLIFIKMIYSQSEFSFILSVFGTE